MQSDGVHAVVSTAESGETQRSKYPFKFWIFVLMGTKDTSSMMKHSVIFCGFRQISSNLSVLTGASLERFQGLRSPSLWV